MNINLYGTGMFMPYSMGIIGYIKKHFPLTDVNITGISGGAICSILYTQEDDLDKPLVNGLRPKKINSPKNYNLLKNTLEDLLEKEIGQSFNRGYI
jgi:hypothetical protein